jgi:crossover junction endodeoxyribonuclease RuvC
MNEDSITIGLDMSLTGTGFCLYGSGKTNIETIKTTPKTCDNDLARLIYITDEVMKRIPSDTKMICIEDFFTPQNAKQLGSAIKLAMLGASIRIALYKIAIPFYIVAPSQIKKYGVGSGAAQKSIIVREVFKRYGLEVKDDNQADACIMAHLAHDILWYPMLTENAPKYQVEVIEKVVNDRPHYNIPGKGNSEPIGE